MSRLSKKKQLPVIIVCENIRSAYNVGSIFRCADAARVQEIILVGITPTPLNKKVKKTSLGAEKTVPWRHLWNRETCIQDLQKKKFTILALESTKNSKPYSSFRATFPLALIVGNEVEGIDVSTLAKADHIIQIPMRGKKESLNVSHATAVVLFDFARKYFKK